MTLNEVLNQIRLLEQPTRRKLAVTKQSGGYLVWCCVCDSGIGVEKNKPVYYTIEQKVEVKEDLFKNKLSHGYCSLCLEQEKYNLNQFRNQK